MARAAAEATGGPVWGNAPDPSTLPVHQTFTGTVTADATMTKLAIFSDDGSAVYVDGALVWSSKDKPQALPDIPNSLHELPVTLTPGSHSVEIDYSNVYYTVADASKGIPPDIDGCTLFMYGPSAVPVVTVSTGNWQPDPAAVGQTITSTVTAAVKPSYQSPNGDSISQHWAWTTGGVYQSQDGSSGSFTPYTGNYAIGWTQDNPMTAFRGIFNDPGFYIIKVIATVTFHDDTTGSDIAPSYSGTGYIGGSASDVSDFARSPTLHPNTALHPNADPTDNSKGITVILGFMFDSWGKVLVTHWLAGNGTFLTIHGTDTALDFGNGTVSPTMGDYLCANPGLTTYVLQFLNSQRQQTHLARGDSKIIDARINAVISPGTPGGSGLDLTGYTVLHGVKMSVGGLHIIGVVRHHSYDDGYYFDIAYEWNDIINPHPGNGSDAYLSSLAKVLGLAANLTPKDYQTHILWSRRATFYPARSVHKSIGWPFN